MWRKGTMISVGLCGLSFLLTTKVAAAPGEWILGKQAAAGQRDDAAAAAAFEAMVPVLHHPRCMNCHSRGNFPRQGDDTHPHTMDVRRGPEGHGVTAQKCSTCHQDHNLAGENMPPGAPDWHLPTTSMTMIWEGLNDQQLCELFKDSRQNGHRTVDQIIEHMNTPLVVWGWNPGEGRTPIAISQAEFMANVKQWVAKGAACPGTKTASASIPAGHHLRPDNHSRGKSW